MRSYLYLSTAVAGVVMTAGAGTSFAQCVTTQNCAELGYTETSCPDGTGIKCPFGDTFACTGGSCANDCAELGFTYPCTGANESGSGKSCGGKYQSCTCTSPYTWSNGACSCPSTYQYTCTGTGYSGGVGTACGGKYTKCTCKSGYEWKDGSCQKQILNGAQGDLYYCNGKVVGVRATGMGFYVAMKDLGRMIWYNANNQCRNYSFCGNAEGTLPTRDQLLSIYQNKSRVNSLLSTNGGTKMTNDWYWSSTTDGSNGYYIVSMSDGLVSINYSGSGYYYFRPVLTSW